MQAIFPSFNSTFDIASTSAKEIKNLSGSRVLFVLSKPRKLWKREVIAQEFIVYRLHSISSERSNSASSFSLLCTEKYLKVTIIFKYLEFCELEKKNKRLKLDTIPTVANSVTYTFEHYKLASILIVADYSLIDRPT